MRRSLVRIPMLVLVVVMVVGTVFAGCAAPQAAPAATPTTVGAAAVQYEQQGIERNLSTPTAAAAAAPAALTSAPAPTAPPATSGQPKKGGTLRIILAGTPPQFGWTPTFAAQETNSADPAVEALLTFDKAGNPLPKLATAWEIAPDSKSITLKLRQGVKFHDGTDFNAEAAKYNLDLVLKLRKGELIGVNSVDVIDNYTIKLNLDYFANNLWDRLGARCGMSSPAHLAKGEDFCKFFPLGTGPFKFVEWKRDSYVKFVRNDNYWQPGLPYLDALEILYVKDAMAAQAAMLAGEADMYVSGDNKVMYDLKAKGYRIAAVPGFMMGLSPDTKNQGSVFADKRVRQALEYAIDRVALTDKLGFGALATRDQFVITGFLGYVDGLQRKYDPAKAKQLLSEAGYPQGFKTTIFSDVEYASRDMTAAIQAYLADVGITANIEYPDAARYAELRRQSGWKDGLMYMRNGGFPWTPNLSSFIFDTKRNDYASMKRPDGLQPLLDTLLAAQTKEAQAEAAKKFTQALYDDATYINLYIQYNQTAHAPYVHDSGRMETTISDWTPEKCWLDK